MSYPVTRRLCDSPHDLTSQIYYEYTVYYPNGKVYMIDRRYPNGIRCYSNGIMKQTVNVFDQSGNVINIKKYNIDCVYFYEKFIYYDSYDYDIDAYAIINEYHNQWHVNGHPAYVIIDDRYSSREYRILEWYDNGTPYKAMVDYSNGIHIYVELAKANKLLSFEKYNDSDQGERCDVKWYEGGNLRRVRWVDLIINNKIVPDYMRFRANGECYAMEFNSYGSFD